MKLTLHYRGRLKANGQARDKHTLRRHFHLQLQQFWKQPPMTFFDSFYAASASREHSIVHQVGAFSFVPLVCTGFYLVAGLRITLLRPGPPGALVAAGGDIDNRLKTLLDSLKVPEANSLPRGAKPEGDERPFFCLLEDDSLVVELDVRTRQLLEPGVPRGEAVVLIDVQTKKTGTLMGGMELP